MSVEGKVVLKTDTDAILDLGTKAEGVISNKDFPAEQLEQLKVGDNLSAFVVVPENESGQVILSLYKQLNLNKKQSSHKNSNRSDYQKFYQALNSKAKLTGRVLEVNKGGLMVDVGGTRGFLPSSQISFQALSGKADLSKGLDGLIGQDIELTVIEVDPNQNRLIFASRPKLSVANTENLAKIEIGDKIQAKIIAVMPFGAYVEYQGLEGVIYPQESAWERVEDLNSLFMINQEVEVVVVGKDEGLTRLLLSTKQLAEDPFEKISEDFQPDDVVKGTVKEITTSGVSVELKNGVEGLLPTAKMEQGASYTPGQKTNFLVDSVDKTRRRINLAPFITSTAGLIYK